jgi:ABC-type transport system substrate-binding protein
LCAGLLAVAGLVTSASVTAQPAAPTAPKVLRWAFPAAETSFDPAAVSDLYSRLVTTHIFEALYRFDYLARPVVVVPNTADGMPEVSPDFKTWTVRIKPGIYFADDPAFQGKKRELVAEDYVYAWKRFFDPAVKSPGYSSQKQEGVLGADTERQAALKAKRPFNYAAPIEGLRALDRYTLQFRLEAARPRFIYTLADSSTYAAVAREVVESYGEKIGQHPVGTGPFRLASWRRSSQIVLERNPSYREVLYDGQPRADDVAGQALLQRFKGRRLPMVDRVELSIVDESQPRWLAFLNGQFDLLAVPLEFSSVAVPNGELAPNLAKQGIRLNRQVNPDYTFFFFNMDDPLVGGYTPEKVALRRAISLGSDVQREIATVRRGQAIPAQSMVMPGSFGYDPAYKSENSEYSVPRAKALLDMFGYVDRDGDGWRELPDGKPLVLKYASQPDAISRSFDELWKKNMDTLGLRLEVQPGQWPEQLKAARAGTLMIWQLGSSASTPDVQPSLELLYGPAAGGSNLARFKLERFDQVYDQMQSLPDGPQRQALLRDAQAIVTAYMPMKYNVHRIVNDLSQPWLQGYRRPLYGNQFWHYVDIDDSLRPKR